MVQKVRKSIRRAVYARCAEAEEVTQAKALRFGMGAFHEHRAMAQMWCMHPQSGGKKLFQNMVFSKTTACSSYVQPWLVAIGGWRLVEIAGWRLAVGGWRRLAAVGGSWQLVMGGWWRLAAVDGWRLAAVGSCRLVAVGG